MQWTELCAARGQQWDLLVRADKVFAGSGWLWCAPAQCSPGQLTECQTVQEVCEKRAECRQEPPESHGDQCQHPAGTGERGKGGGLAV